MCAVDLCGPLTMNSCRKQTIDLAAIAGWSVFKQDKVLPLSQVLTNSECGNKPHMVRNKIRLSYICILQVGNIQVLFACFALLVLLLGFGTEYLNGILRIYVTRATPYGRCSHQVAYALSAFFSQQEAFTNTHCMAFITVLTSTVTNGMAVVAPIKANCRAVLYLLIVVGCTSAEGSEKSQYLENVLGGGNDIHR
jgi:hypothetical protein